MIRTAHPGDLERVVEIYNAAIPGRLATADTTPVSSAQRQAWFCERDARHPVWVLDNAGVQGWLSFGEFYGRPAYQATVEFGLYVAPSAQRQGVGSALLRHALQQAPLLGIRTVLGFVFAHNTPSVVLCERFGFQRWGHLPEVAELDGVERDLLILGLRL